MAENTQDASIALKVDSIRESSASNLVLSTHPLSSGYREQLEDRLGAPTEYLLVSAIRTLGVKGAVKRLRTLSPNRLLIAYEDEDSRVIVPVLECIGALTRANSMEVVDPSLTVEPVTLGHVAWSSLRLVWATFQCFRARRRAAGEVARLLKEPMPATQPIHGREILYLNTNLWFGVKAGGSVGHIAGVTNALHKGGWKVRYASVSDSSVIDAGVERRLFDPPRAHGLPPELNHYRFGQSALHQARRMAAERRPSFIYQRMSIGNYTGARLARVLDVPLVLEYNGSEVWTARHWGRRMIYEDLALDAERASLRHASLVVTVSEALADQLREAGVPEERIVWYPNCVDATVFDPTRFGDADVAAIRARHGLAPQDTVISFIGTFGRWHGVDVLAKAIRRLVDDERAWLDENRVRFLIVGDGHLMPTVRTILSGPADHQYVVLTGLVRQEEAPGYLAAADVVVSPHVPNPDGSPFFGSPTKLFEYMIMGKAIVASDLDQIGRVLGESVRASALPDAPPGAEERRLAVLARPDSLDDLVEGMRFVITNRDWRATLGANARSEALKKYLWEHHVKAILDRIPGAV